MGPSCCEGPPPLRAPAICGQTEDISSCACTKVLARSLHGTVCLAVRYSGLDDPVSCLVSVDESALHGLYKFGHLPFRHSQGRQ